MASRELSCFLCRELIYEFLMNSLDERRRQAVELHLSNCHDCSAIVLESKRALRYLQELSATKISTKAVQDLNKQNVLSMKRVGWRRLPESLRWGLEALLAALVVGASFHFGSQWFSNRAKPAPQEVVLTEGDTLPGEAGVSNLPEDKLPDADSEEGTPPSEEGAAATEEATAATEKDETPTPTSEVATGIITPEDFVVPEKPLVLALNPPPLPATAPLAKATSTPQPSIPPVVAATSPTTSSIAPAPHTSGFVFRMAMTVKNADLVTPKMKTAIEEMGGQKAGQVQLGWKKTGGSYFHFTLPEAKHDELMKMLRSFAQVRYSKDPHKRIMPPGTIRVILWVEELDAPKSAPAPSSSPESDSANDEQSGQMSDEAGDETNSSPVSMPVESTPTEDE